MRTTEAGTASPAQATRRAPACTAAFGAIDGIRTRASGDTTRRSTTELRTPRWRRSDSNRQPSACEADALPDLSYIPSPSRQESNLRPLRRERSALPSELRDVGRSQGIEPRPRPEGPFPLRYRLAGSRLAGQLSCCRSGTRTRPLNPDGRVCFWLALRESNPRPHPRRGCALPSELNAIEQGREDSNPHHPVLETGVFPIRPRPFGDRRDLNPQRPGLHPGALPFELRPQSAWEGSNLQPPDSKSGALSI